MAKKSTKKAFSSAASREKRRQIWRSGDISKWKSFFVANDPQNKIWEVRGGTSIWGQCRFPDHVGEDSTPSMRVHVEKSYVKCYGCQTYESDPIKFMTLVSGKSYSDAAKDIQTYFNIQALSKTDIKRLDEDYRHVTMKNNLAHLLRTELHDAYSAWEIAGRTSLANTSYEYAEPLLAYLLDRKILHNCRHLCIGILPTEMRLKELAKIHAVSDTDVREMIKYLKDVLDIFYLGSLVYIYNATPKNVSRFRIRRPVDDGHKNIIAVSDPNEDYLGIFGLAMYGEIADRKEGVGNTVKALVVEGEFDQMQYASMQIDNANFDWIVLAHSGGTNRNLSELKDYGIRDIYYLPDCDTGGDTNAREIMAENADFKFHIFNWPDRLIVPGNENTDLDLALKQYGFEPVREAVSDVEHNWLGASMWCKEQIRKVLRDKGPEIDEQAIIYQVQTFAPCVSENQEWTENALIEFGINVEKAKKCANAFVTKDSAESAYAELLEAKLRQSFDFIAVDSSKVHLPMKAWHREKKGLIEIRMGSEAHVKALFSSTAGSFVQWASKHVGLPDFIRYLDGESETPMERSPPAQNAMLVERALLVLQDISATLPQLASLKTYGAGCHWLKVKGRGEFLFVVNGPHVFKAEFTRDGLPQWEELESPVFGEYLFETKKPLWSTEIKCLEDLTHAPEVSLKELITRTYDILDTGWLFTSQDTECMAHAAFIVASAVLKIFPQNLQFLASNERGSGKSTLYAELIGGAKNTDVNLVEHSICLDNITAAGLRQTMDGSSLILVLDEFDNQQGGKHHSERMDEILRILRTSSAGEGIYAQGTQSGEARNWNLSFATMIAGIDPNITDANMSRFYQTDLKSSVDSKIPPKVAILAKFTQKHIDETRSLISRSVFRYIPKILQSYGYVRKYCATQDTSILGPETIQRFKDTMLILMAILHAADMDWEGWARKTVKAKKKAIVNLGDSTEHTRLISAIRFTSNIEVPGLDVPKRNVVHFIENAMDLTERQALNNSGSGAMMLCDAKNPSEPSTWSWYLVIIWQQALTGILRNTSYGRTVTNAASLKTTADRDIDAVSNDDITTLLENMPEVPSYLKTTPITVLNITSRVRDAMESKVKARAKGLAIVQREEAQVLNLPR